MIEELAVRIIERFMEELEDPDAAIKIVWEECEQGVTNDSSKNTHLAQ